jgi:hypothetical protein
MAPTPVALYQSIGLGAVLGLAGLLWERYMFGRQREFLLAFNRDSLRERLRWKYQRKNLLLSGWVLLALFGLLGWCLYQWVFVLPAVFSADAVLFAGNSRVAGEFQMELRQANPVEPGAAAARPRD